MVIPLKYKNYLHKPSKEWILAMIVKCKAIFNQNTNEYLEIDPFGDLIQGYHYNVLAIELSNDGISYRINTDRDGLLSCSIPVLAKDFEIVSTNIPDNWILNKEFAELSPQKWSDISLWEESFWQDYFEDLPKATSCYREEIKTIVSADKDYIQTMIDERADRDIFYTWQDTMLPLFAEVLEGR